MSPSPLALAATPVAESSRLPRLHAGWYVLAALLVVGWRLRLCAQAPHDSADVLRHLYTALAVLRDGLGALSQPLSSLAPSLSATVPWSAFPYNYPIGAVAFFALVASIQPSVFTVKIVLTLIEAANSALVGAITGSKLAALAYWTCPLSLWWVSHEAQFEPVQTLPMFLAWWLLVRRPGLAGALLALAVQVKLTALLLLPLCAAQVWRGAGPRARRSFFLGFALGLVPSLFALPFYPMAVNVLATSTWPVSFNPWYWNMLDSTRRWWLPISYALTAQAGLAVALVVLLYGLWRERRRLAAFRWAAPLGFVGLAKTAGVFQPWYWLVFTAFLPTLHRARAVVLLCLLLPVIEPLSSWQLLRHRVGPDNFPASISVRQKLHLP